MDKPELLSPETIKSIQSVLATAITIITGVFYRYKRNKKKLTKLNIDNTDKILGSIKSMENNLESFKEEIKKDVKKLQDDILILKEELTSVKIYTEKEEFITNIRRSIKETTSSFIRNNGLSSITDSCFITLVDHGKDAALTFVSDCIKSGLKGMNTDDIEVNINSIFDSLRIIAERYMDEKFVDELKNNTRIYNHIETFKTGLSQVSANIYNGNTNKAFTNIMLEFINNMYKDGLIIYKKLKEDDNITMR